MSASSKFSRLFLYIFFYCIIKQNENFFENISKFIEIESRDGEKSKQSDWLTEWLISFISCQNNV